MKCPECGNDDVLDWDAYVAKPPPAKSGTIKVKLKYVKRKIMPYFCDDPDCEACNPKKGEPDVKNI